MSFPRRSLQRRLPTPTHHNDRCDTMHAVTVTHVTSPYKESEGLLYYCVSMIPRTRYVVLVIVGLIAASCSSGSSELESRVERLEREVFAATSSTLPESGTVMLSGEIDVRGRIGIGEDLYRLDDNPTECVASGAGLTKGLEVIVYDQDRSVIGVAVLQIGALQEDVEPEGAKGWGNCAMPFLVEVPDDAGFYTVEIDGRPSPTFSRSDLVSLDWHISLEG